MNVWKLALVRNGVLYIYGEWYTEREAIAWALAVSPGDAADFRPFYCTQEVNR